MYSLDSKDWLMHLRKRSLCHRNPIMKHSIVDEVLQAPQLSAYLQVQPITVTFFSPSSLSQRQGNYFVLGTGFMDVNSEQLSSRNEPKLLQMLGHDLMENCSTLSIHRRTWNVSEKENLYGIATCMLQAKTPEFVQYQKQIVANAKALAAALMEHGYKISTGGTDVHMMLIDLRGTGISGAKAEFVLEQVNIAVNKNTVPGDKSALNPSGFRIGTAALTTRGFDEENLKQVAGYIDRALKIAKEVSGVSGPKLTDFKRVALEDPEILKKVACLKLEVAEYAYKFPMPGYKRY